MVSQIISAVKDERSLLRWWDRWAEIVWMGSWSFVGGILVLWRRSLFYRGFAIGIALVVLVGSCYILLLAGFWIPLVPSALGLIVTGAGVTTYLKSDR
ncbi:MAG: hypothetical protein HC847_17420 [Hydrococcus sp. RU_2_2]|nr:hypothetical protein [Hydrococcus sp. RU_2_2]